MFPSWLNEIRISYFVFRISYFVFRTSGERAESITYIVFNTKYLPAARQA